MQGEQTSDLRTVASPQAFAKVARSIAMGLIQQAQQSRLELASVQKPQERALSRVVTGHWYAYAMCIFYSLLNQAGVYKDLGLKIVIGSLGLGIGDKPYWEHGNPTASKASAFLLEDGRSTDLHMWLEDENGCVFDVISNEFIGIAFIRGCRTDLLRQNPEILEGAPKQNLSMRGFHYVPAPIKVQAELWVHLCKVHARSFADLRLPVPVVLNGTIPTTVCK
jgi:hypothetical protein